MKSDYYINKKGEHVMTYPVFKAMPFNRLCHMMGLNPEGIERKPKKGKKK